MDEVISKEEAMNRVWKLKNGRSAEISGIAGEMVKDRRETIIDWIGKLYNKAFMVCGILMDFKWVTRVSLYKWREDKVNCRDYKGINSPSVVRKIYSGEFGWKSASSNWGTDWWKTRCI